MRPAKSFLVVGRLSFGNNIMTSLMGPRRFAPGDRFFKLAKYITIYMDMETYAITASQGLPLRQPGQWFATLRSRLFPVHIRHNVYGPFWATFHPLSIAHYEFTFVPAAPSERKATNFQQAGRGNRNVLEYRPCFLL